MEANNAFDGNKNGNEFLFSETLADIVAEKEDLVSTDSEEESEEEADASEAEADKNVKIQNVVKKQSIKEQIDWMNINVDDI